MQSRSRKVILLSRRDEKRRVKKTIYLALSSIVLLGFLLLYGVPILGKFADFLDVVFGKKAADNTALQAGALPPPQLDLLPQATNSANLKVTGFAQNGEVEIYPPRPPACQKSSARVVIASPLSVWCVAGRRAGGPARRGRRGP